ncbi:hypothetical protein HPB50_002064 [Hyalomma asiaticum]|uniref:Uncharacterized protein n=1 Tax=Hyalomma asiaticum TaxID=266040 RepID=A0ACB7T8C7_HYAAI|nr:hypothetical protein HPB50_002064 [Hyalomma asiaticum]
MAAAFSDTLAMALVAIGSALTGLLIWFLMRQYNREYRREAEPSRVTTPVSMSRETTATLVGPWKRPEQTASVTGVDSEWPASQKRAKTKKIQATSLDENLSSAVMYKDKKTEKKPKDKATKDKPKERSPKDKSKDTRAEEKPKDKATDKPAPDKEAIDEKPRGQFIKKPTGSPGSDQSLEEKEQQPKGESQKKKSKKSDKLSPTTVDSGLSKPKGSKQHKRSKPSETKAAQDPGATSEGPASPAKTAGGAAQEPGSATGPSKAEAPQPVAKSPTVAIVDPGPSSDTRDLDDSTLQKLRKEVLMRRASHASMRSTRSRSVAEAPKIPAQLDIFSEEHSSASNAPVGPVKEKQPKHEHKNKHKRKTSASRKVASAAADAGLSSGTMSECTSPPRGPEASGTGTGAVPPSESRDLDESTLQQLRRDITMRRASHVSQRSVRPQPRAAKVPPDLDIFSEGHSSASAVETCSPPPEKETGEQKHKHKHATLPSGAQEASPVPAAGTAATGPTLPTGSLDESTVEEMRRDLMKRRASHASVHSVRLQRRMSAAPKAPSDLDIFSDEHSSESNAVPGSPSKTEGKKKVDAPKVKVTPAPTAGGTSGTAPATGDLDERTVQELRKDLMKRRASHVSMHSLRQQRSPREGAVSPKLPTDLDIFSEQHTSIIEDPPQKKGKKGSKMNIFSEQPSLE